MTARPAAAEASTELLKIAALGHEGDGIAETPAGRVFVPYALPGETVEAARSGERATLRRVLIAAPERVEPPCRHFGACGGCSVQHLAAEAYLSWKRALVAAAFRQRGIEAPVAPIVPVPPGSRRRVVLAAVHGRSGVVLGYSRRQSHEIVPVTECPIAVPAIAGNLALLRRIAAASVTPGSRARLAVVAADNGLDVAVEHERPPPAGHSPSPPWGGVRGGGRAARSTPGERRLPSRRASGRATSARRNADAGDLPADLLQQPALARLTVDGEVIAQLRRPEIVLGDGVSLLPVPGGFLQAAAAAEATMAEAVLAGLGEPGRAGMADLFAGIGTFSLRIARSSPVTAVEGDTAAAAALDEAVRRASSLRPVTVRRRDLSRNPLAPAELAGFSAVVFDPPRAGAHAQAEALAASRVPRIVAVSCNPATLARDARILLDGGYRLLSVTPVDQFLWSAHVEAVAVFAR